MSKQFYFKQLSSAEEHIFLFIHNVTRKYDTLIHSPGWGKGAVTIVVSRIMEREAVSLFTLSIITRWHRQSRTSLSIGHVWVGGEANRRPWLVLRKKQPKSQHVGNFQTTETSYLPFIHQRGKPHNELPFIRRRTQTH